MGALITVRDLPKPLKYAHPLCVWKKMMELGVSKEKAALMCLAEGKVHGIPKLLGTIELRRVNGHEIKWDGYAKFMDTRLPLTWIPEDLRKTIEKLEKLAHESGRPDLAEKLRSIISIYLWSKPQYLPPLSEIEKTIKEVEKELHEPWVVEKREQIRKLREWLELPIPEKLRKEISSLLRDLLRFKGISLAREKMEELERAVMASIARGGMK